MKIKIEHRHIVAGRGTVRIYMGGINSGFMPFYMNYYNKRYGRSREIRLWNRSPEDGEERIEIDYAINYHKSNHPSYIFIKKGKLWK